MIPQHVPGSLDRSSAAVVLLADRHVTTQQFGI